MILTEKHTIKRKKSTEDLFQQIDQYCYLVKNLHNTVNYQIKQCRRICGKLEQGLALEPWESEMLDEINEGIRSYNLSRKGKKPLVEMKASNSNLANAYFLSWYLKGKDVYREVPYATCAQICIQEVCRNWKSYYAGLKAWKQDATLFTGLPKPPGYLEKETGRSSLVLTGQNVSLDEKQYLHFPKFLQNLRLRMRKKGLNRINQVRILTEKKRIQILIQYEVPKPPYMGNNRIMGIDPGVNNLLTLVMNTAATPIIINGRPIKSSNQYYNKKKSELQSIAKKVNSQYFTNRMYRMTEKRNGFLKDYMHKASRKVIQIAQENQIGIIVIGRNKGWKQEVSMGNKTNQNFVSIPHHMLINQIRYKAEQAGIQVIEIEESYTSGTSCLDREAPVRENYDKSRRVKRGLFKSNKGIYLNADVNAAYQILRKAGCEYFVPEKPEAVSVIKVS